MKLVLSNLCILSATVLMLWAGNVLAQETGSSQLPLRPADTSSPRDTLQSFDEEITKAIVGWRSGLPFDSYRTPAYRAMETFDFSHLSGSDRPISKLENALFLKEILDRIPALLYKDAPGDEDAQVQDKSLVRWTIPDTRITIARMPDGPRSGEYLFSSDTVDRLEDFYLAVKDLPYNPDGLVNARRDYMTSPGSLMPAFISRNLPDWSKTIVLGEALWQWAGFAICTIILWVTVHLVLTVSRRIDRRRGDLSRAAQFVLPFAVLVSIILAYGYQIVVVFALRLGGEIGAIILSLVWIGIFVGLCSFAILFLSRLAEVINKAKKVSEGSIDGQMLKTLLRLIGVVTIIALVLNFASFFGIPMTPVLASLGVGGLAIALAVRPTLENIIGGLILFADKPVRTGDKCEFGGQLARVEEIGLRSTRLRRRDGRVVVVPNADFSQRELINYSLADYRVYSPTIPLELDTDPDLLAQIVAEMRDMLELHPRVSSDVLSVRFGSIGAFSLNISIFAYADARDWVDDAEIHEDLNFRLLDIVKKAGAKIAFPTQTLLVEQSDGPWLQTESRRSKAQ